jgi:hypothetical protein
LKTGSSYWMNHSKKGKTHENGAQDETWEHRSYTKIDQK